MIKNIYKKLLGGFDIFIVGETNSGKSFFVRKNLFPFLKKQKNKPIYFKDGNVFNFNKIKNKDIVIIDEVEILADRKFLERRHPEEKPYFSNKYLRRVGLWHNKFKKIKIPAIYIITRNDKKEINFLIRKIKQNEWNGQKTCVFSFCKKNRIKIFNKKA